MLFDDEAWLGSEHASFGSYARAAVGILIPKNEWRWWHLASFSDVLESLESAGGGNGIVVWGGDEAVLDLHHWVDPMLAINVAEAFRAIQPSLQLKISRQVWKWPNFRGAAASIHADLTRALSPERVFFEWPLDRRPRRPKIDREEGRLVVTSVSDAGSDLALHFADTLPDVTWQPNVQAADVVVATSVDQLAAGKIVADLAVVLEADSNRLLDKLDEIRVASGARCIVRLSDAGNAAEWLALFGSAWSFPGIRIDAAIAQANAETGLTGEIVAANQTFLLRSGSFLSPNFMDRSISRSRSPSPPSEEDVDAFPGRTSQFIERTAGPSSPTMEAASPFTPPVARVLNAIVYASSRRVQTLPRLGEIQIEIAIKPTSPLHDNKKPAFPDHLVGWEGDSRTLQVHMVELGRKPVTRSLLLPRKGESEPVYFPYELAAGSSVDLRMMVCDGAHILQTARFQGVPGSPFEFFIEAEVASIDGKRKAFDLALLVNDSLGNKPSVTTLTEKGVHVTLLENSDIGKLRDRCREILEPIVTNPDLPARDAMLDLANVGGQMLDALKYSVPDWPDNFDRVQLMTKNDAFFPFEYLYEDEGAFPTSLDVELCPKQCRCLSNGRARSPCSIRESATALCPMGFFGVSKIIERQRWDKKVESPLWLRLPTAPGSRKRVIINDVAFAASDLADNFEDDDLPAGQKLARISDVSRALGPTIPNWNEWKAVVTRDRPTMLVLVAHIERDALHIGANAALPIQAMKDPYLGKAPIAIAIGCNSAIGTVPQLGVPAAMMRHGVKVVIAALTDVLGRYSNEAAMLLATRMRDASRKPTPVTVGEFVTKMRRRLLARKIALGLVLVAFGDADLALGGTD